MFWTQTDWSILRVFRRATHVHAEDHQRLQESSFAYITATDDWSLCRVEKEHGERASEFHDRVSRRPTSSFSSTLVDKSPLEEKKSTNDGVSWLVPFLGMAG